MVSPCVLNYIFTRTWVTLRCSGLSSREYLPHSEILWSIFSECGNRALSRFEHFGQNGRLTYELTCDWLEASSDGSSRRETSFSFISALRLLSEREQSFELLKQTPSGNAYYYCHCPNFPYFFKFFLRRILSSEKRKKRFPFVSLLKKQKMLNNRWLWLHYRERLVEWFHFCGITSYIRLPR